MSHTADFDLWSAGLPLASSRALSDAERAELGGRMAAFRRKGLAALLGVPLALTLFFALAPLSDDARAAALVIPLILVTVVTPLLVLIARDCLLLARDLARDLRNGRADRFEGCVGYTALDHTLQRLVRAGLLRKGGSEAQWIEVLPESGLVLHANGSRPAHWIRAAYAETAQLPTYAGIAAEWVESVDTSREDAFHVARRELSAGEVAEVRRHIRRIVLRPSALGLFLTLWLGGVTWALFAGFRSLQEPHHIFLLAVLAAVTAQADISLARCAVLGFRMSRDIRLRTAVIVRSPALVPRADPSGDLLPPDEFLACSGVLWTRAGSPAPWRLIPGW